MIIDSTYIAKCQFFQKSISNLLYKCLNILIMFFLFTVKEQCVVIFPYNAVNDDELTLEEGQIVTIVSKDVEDKGWWKGEVDGRTGVFPDNFVKLISPTTITAADDVSRCKNRCIHQQVWVDRIRINKRIILQRPL